MGTEQDVNVYYLRALGRDYTVTEGSEHYKGGGIEPVEFAMANGRFEDFAIVNITKYAERFSRTRNTDDLKKVVDYANILCGIELDKKSGEF